MTFRKLAAGLRAVIKGMDPDGRYSMNDIEEVDYKEYPANKNKKKETGILYDFMRPATKSEEEGAAAFVAFIVMLGNLGDGRKADL